VAEHDEGAVTSPGGSSAELGVCGWGEEGGGIGEAGWQGATGGVGGARLPEVDEEVTRWIQIRDGDDGTCDGWR
jgi:hypothetical protein